MQQRENDKCVRTAKGNFDDPHTIFLRSVLPQSRRRRPSSALRHDWLCLLRLLQGSCHSACSLESEAIECEAVRVSGLVSNARHGLTIREGQPTIARSSTKHIRREVSSAMEVTGRRILGVFIYLQLPRNLI